MKTKEHSLKIFCFLLFVLASFTSADAQILKKLGKRAEKAAERAVERRVEQETTKKTDQVLDSILEPGKNQKEPTDKEGNILPANRKSNSKAYDSEADAEISTIESKNSETKSIQIYSKFDYVPGDNLIFFDDFSNDFVGDFPSKWNTNGGGEIVTMNDSSEKWLELISGYNLNYLPDVPKLPEEYTIEFDIMTAGLDNKTSSTAFLQIALSDDDKFKEGANFVQARLSFCQYSPIGITMENQINTKRDIYSTVKADLREEVLNRPHVSIAVNQQRFRLWVNEEKHIDIPRIVPEGAILSTLKFHMNNFKDGKERLFITNLKVAEGGLDLRRTLISEGKVSTNGILFDSGSANIQAQSMGIIRQISQVLQQESGMILKIVGHTDADGEDTANMTLSKKRAEAVKNVLISVYNIDVNRLQTDGKGESEPMGDNTTSDGKAQNRRVEFIKQ
jgi:outer membrane protein OmpA-like peptidoglycan-associated protein